MSHDIPDGLTSGFRRTGNRPKKLGFPLPGSGLGTLDEKVRLLLDSPLEVVGGRKNGLMVAIKKKSPLHTKLILSGKLERDIYFSAYRELLGGFVLQ